MSNPRPTVVLVVGQVPPPVTGQAVMIQQFLSRTYPGLQLVHVPMEFSRNTSEIGNVSGRKLLLLLQTLFNIVRARWQSGATILYYPPASPNLAPVLRDLFLLLPIRPLFRRTAFHFHVAGLCTIYSRLPGILKPLFRRAYGSPDLVIFTTQATAADGDMLGSKATAIVPCGAPDMAGEPAFNRPVPAAPTILFAGILCEGKGILILLQACLHLRSARIPFHLVCMGAFASPAFEQQVRTFLEDNNLQDAVSFPGVLTGDSKRSAFASADIFCFPSHYPAESFGVVLIEAMSFALPIVATDWQGIPEVTGERGTFLVPVQQPQALADALALLLQSPDLRLRMGLLNRSRYLAHFTAQVYCNRLATALNGLEHTAAPVQS